MQIANPFAGFDKTSNKVPPIRNSRPDIISLEGAVAKIVYHSDKLTSEEVSQVFERSRLKLDNETSRHDLDNAQEAFLGITAHEDAEQAFEAFTAEFTKYKQPENLTRAEVKKLFEQSPYGKALQKYEQIAISHFSKVLENNKNFFVAPSENTGFDAIDIKTYLIDLQNRVAERLEDPEERKAKLEELDAELANLIKSVPEESWGKKLELQEIYLLRRLIHRADTGHLAHVSHGTLRQDLRSDMGSVDMRLVVAGDIFNFQLKTFKSGVSDQARARQFDVIAHSKHRAEESGTHYAMLDTDRVQIAYDRSQRQQATENQTVGDKFAALQPLTNNFNNRERSRLLKVVGLNEEILAKEQAAFDEQQLQMDKHQETVRALREIEEVKQARRNEERAAFEEREANEAARKIAAIQARLNHEEAQRSESMEKRQSEAEEKERNQLARQTKKDKEKALVKEAEAARAAIAAAAKAAEAKKAKTKETKAQSEAKAKWVKTKAAALMNIPALIKAGFLAEENKTNFVQITAAKKVAEALYTKKYILEHFPFEDSLEQENPAAE